MPFSRGSSQLRDWTQVFHIAGRFFTIWAIREAQNILVCVCVCVCVYSYIYLNHFAVQQKLTLYINYESESEVAQSCPTLCDPMDYSLPGSSVHGILQARTLEWFAMPFSRRSSQPRDWAWVSCTAGRLFTIGATRETPVVLACFYFSLYNYL